jgi:RHH-type proline utilization regulon transcriptional repressor/proline dehydrogenase/delta 1-pyrroline-5-carboxylate dehydrogenase
VNRNIVGAVVGVQPFGGEGKSGTGPKAGGPLYLKRLQKDAAPLLQRARHSNPALDALMGWMQANGHGDVAVLAEGYTTTTLDGVSLDLPGPTGERNVLGFTPRGAILCAAAGVKGMLNQLAAVLVTGNRALVLADSRDKVLASLPAEVKQRLRFVGEAELDGLEIHMAMVESGLKGQLQGKLAARHGAIVGIVDTQPNEPVALWRLVAERAVCVNTTAAGGNASLMTLGG